MPFALNKSDGRLRADLHKPERLENEHVSLCTYTMDMKDMNRWQVFLPCMNVHTHLQAAALRIYPHKKLLLPKGSVVCETDQRRGGKGPSLNTKYVRGICKKDAPECFKFDVAQVWNLHSPSSYVTPYGFRRALTGENQDLPVSELDHRKYSSLEILKYWDTDRPSRFKYRAVMNAEDLLKFMLSDFARKGQYDEIFEPSDCDTKTFSAPLSDCVTQTQISQDFSSEIQHPHQNSPAAQAIIPDFFKKECLSPKISSLPGSTHQCVFVSSCVERNRELQAHFNIMSEIETLSCNAEPTCKKRKILAISVIQSMTHLLFDSNKLILDTLICDE